MRTIILLAASVILLSGCLTSEERAQQIADADDTQCQSYGAQPGSTEYFQCRMAKDQQRQANTAALAGIILNRPQPQPYVLPMPQHY
jgi:uncharacterized lipoprotein